MDFYGKFLLSTQQAFQWFLNWAYVAVSPPNLCEPFSPLENHLKEQVVDCLGLIHFKDPSKDTSVQHKFAEQIKLAVNQIRFCVRYWYGNCMQRNRYILYCFLCVLFHAIYMLRLPSPDRTSIWRQMFTYTLSVMTWSDVGNARNILTMPVHNYIETPTYWFLSAGSDNNKNRLIKE